MMGDELARRSGATPSHADLERYDAAVAAAADPNSVMDTSTALFRTMARLTASGDHPAALGAANGVAEDCLRLCAVQAASSVAADDKIRFLTIMARWAWPRRPALAAVFDAAGEAERLAWGLDITSSA